MFALILLILAVVLVIFGLAGRLEKHLLRWNWAVARSAKLQAWSVGGARSEAQVLRQAKAADPV